MSKSPQVTDLSLFNSFCESPKSFSLSVLQGVHRFLLNSLSEKKSSVTKKILIKILMCFVPVEIRECHFRHMNRVTLVELVIYIVQDLIVNGPDRDKLLELQLVKTSSGGTDIDIADPLEDDVDGFDADFLREIDEIDATEFSPCDTSGATPEKKIHLVQDFAQSFLVPDTEGSFITPQKTIRNQGIFLHAKRGRFTRTTV